MAALVKREIPRPSLIYCIGPSVSLFHFSPGTTLTSSSQNTSSSSWRFCSSCFPAANFVLRIIYIVSWVLIPYLIYLFTYLANWIDLFFCLYFIRVHWTQVIIYLCSIHVIWHEAHIVDDYCITCRCNEKPTCWHRSIPVRNTEA